MKRLLFVILITFRLLFSTGSYLALKGTIDGLYLPSGVALDSVGNIYITDTASHQIKKYNPGLVLEAVFPAPGSLKNPQAVALDGNGNIYIADTGNHQIKKYDSAYSLVTIFGTAQGSASDELSYPRDIKIYNNSLHILDSGNHRISIWDLNGNHIENKLGILGSGAGNLNNPYSFAIDSDGTYYIANTYNNRVEIIQPDNSAAFFGTKGVLPDLPVFSMPKGIAVSSDKIYVSDTAYGYLKVFDKVTKNLINYYGTLGSTYGSFK